MINQNLKFIAAFASLAVSAGSAQALTVKEVRALDQNKNNVIDVGSEMQAMIARKEDLNRRQAVELLEAQISGSGDGIPIAKLIVPKLEEKLRADADPAQRFFLRESINGVSLLSSGSVAASDRGASITLGHDNLTDVTDWGITGAIAWLAFLKSPCGKIDRAKVPDRTVLSGCAIAPYLEFNGKGTSAAKGESSLTFGIKSEFEYSGNNTFSLQHVSINPFFTTDFDWSAEIYGVSATWRPISPKLRINAYPASQNDRGTWWWSAYSQAKYQKVEKAGRTNFVSGDDFGWLGGHLAITREFGTKKAGQFFANAGYDYFYDVINDRSADLVSLEAGMYIDEKTKNAIVLEYEKGRNSRDFSKVDGFNLKLRFAF